jgi:dihydroorotase (multifunctional complex type)
LIVDLILANAKAFYRKEIVDCSIAVENGQIFKIGKESQMPHADGKTDIGNLLALPGFIDVHVHLRDEGKNYKEDFYTGTAAAAAGGITTVLDMPNNDPVTMSAETLRNRMGIAKRKALVNVGFYSEFPQEDEETSDIAAQGAVAFKLFMASQIGGANIDDDGTLQKAFERAADAGLPVAVHAEDKASITSKTLELRNKRRDGPKGFLAAHPEQAELKAIERILGIAAKTRTHLHICHVTTKEGLEKIAEAKQERDNVTCEVTPNHLLLSDSDFERRGSMLAMMPPLRSRDQIKALWDAVSNGRVNVLASDHAPHTIEEKSSRSIWSVKVGVPGLETSLPLLLTMVAKQKLSLDLLVSMFAENPAKIFRLDGRGHLETGARADIVIVDFKQKFRIAPSQFHSRAKFSPYDGWEVQGKPVKTFSNGLLIMDEHQIVAKPGSGEIIRRGTP